MSERRPIMLHKKEIKLPKQKGWHPPLLKKLTINNTRSGEGEASDGNGYTFVEPNSPL